jgi:UPF0755 protein
MDKKKKRLYILAVSVLLVLIIGTIYYCLFSSVFGVKKTAYVYVDSDDDADSVYVKVEKAGNPRTMSGFKTLARHMSYDKHIRTGRYAIRPGMSAFRLLRNLQHGMQEPVNLTIPSVRTMDRLAGALSKKLMLDSVKLTRYFTDPTWCQRWGYDTCNIACLFIPNTYQIYWDIPLDKFMARMQKENKAYWNPSRTAKAQAAGLTPNDVYTLASIIDEETANNAEKPMVAGMYINRLHAGMPLQADPTIKFALKQFELHRIYENMLFIKSPYNTYRNIGLPPGPIRIPSVASIEAVLNYVHHGYMYMCAKDDFSGTHAFARTYSEHMANAARYSQALNAKGIK